MGDAVRHACDDGASSSPPAYSADVVSLKLSPQAELLDEGEAVLVTVRALCESPLDVLDAFVSVVQDDVTTQFGFFPAVCDGKQHQFVVRVEAEESQLHEGEARLSGYILLDTPEGSSDSPTRLVRIRG